MSNGEQVEGLDKLQAIAGKALDDDDYRRRLISEPEKVLNEEGLTVPEGVKVEVHENRERHIHLVLPSRPGAPVELEADETDITNLSAGIHF